MNIDEVLINIFRIALRYTIGLNEADESLRAIREELNKLQ